MLATFTTGEVWSRRRPLIAAGVAGLLALAVAFELIRPFASGPVGFDSAASVIHFERISAGRHLEAFVTATPKPLLTLVFGLLHTLTGDWRSVSWATIGAFAACVVLGGWFAWRVAGPAAGIFTAIALLGSRTLLADVVISYAVPWAMVAWLLAGLALVAGRPRPALAGLFLCLAALARLETFAIIGVALVAVAITARPVRRSASAAEGHWWLLAIGLLALPVMLLHDWLLTGDPLFWASVSRVYSTAAPDTVLTPLELGRAIVERYLGMPMLTLLAVTGFFVLARERRYIALIGLLGLSVGVAAFLEVLAVRGTYVSLRYFAAIDMALVVTAAVGAASVAAVGGRLLGGRGTGEQTPRDERTSIRRRVGVVARRAIPLGIVGVLALASIWPVASLNASFRSSARSQRFQAEHADRVLPTIALELASIPGAGTFPPPDAPMSGDLTTNILFVPVLLRPRFVVDLDLPLTQVGSATEEALTPGDGFLPYGELIYHDRLADRRPGVFDVLEVDEPTGVGSVTLVPVLADPDVGIWLNRIER
jgi:hypothetical protein